MEITIKDWTNAPLEIADKYAQKCSDFIHDIDLFNNFKQDPDYQKILEGNEQIVGDIALFSIKKMGRYNDLLNNLYKFKENETVGNPVLIDFPDIGPIAASTLRYVNTAYEINRLVGDNLSTVVEVGGGYGGLYKTLSVLYDLNSYTNLDIQPAVRLSEKYLSYFDLYLNETIPESYDLFIADSSLAECGLEAQRKYIEIAKKAKYVYIVYNTLHLKEGEKGLEYIRDAFKDYEWHEEYACDEIGGIVSNILILSLKKI